MYVCICNAIRDAEIRELARGGVAEPERVYELCGAAPACSSCVEWIQEILDEENARAA